MRKKNFIGVAVVLLLINLIPLTVTGTHQSPNRLTPSGYGEGIIFGIFPRVSDDTITLFMVLPPFGTFTINKLYFTGHLGLFFIYGGYNWLPHGPPAFSLSEY